MASSSLWYIYRSFPPRERKSHPPRHYRRLRVQHAGEAIVSHQRNPEHQFRAHIAGSSQLSVQILAGQHTTTRREKAYRKPSKTRLLVMHMHVQCCRPAGFDRVVKPVSQGSALSEDVEPDSSGLQTGTYETRCSPPPAMASCAAVTAFTAA